MNYRDYLQQLIYRITDPLIRLMLSCRITPNVVTTVGFILNVAAGALFCYAGFVERQQSLALTGAGGWMILGAGLFDMFDGRLARMGNLSSTFGALYDSCMDRYSEIITLSGIFLCLFHQGYALSGIITVLALAGSLMVSYVRARAEGLGIECKVGFMQRPERVVVTAAGTILCGLCASIEAFDPVYFVTGAMALIAVLANLTTCARIRHCRKELR